MNLGSIPSGSRIAVLDKLTFSEEVGDGLAKNVRGASLEYHGGNMGSLLDAVRDHQSVGVVPVRNYSEQLPRWEYLRLLAQYPELRVIGDVRHNVRMCIGGLPDASLENATGLASHPAGIGQTTDARRLYGLKETIPCKTTAAAVEYVRERGDPRMLVAATRKAIETNGLRILLEDAANGGSANVTRFLVTQRIPDGAPLPYRNATRHAVLLTGGTPATDIRKVIAMYDLAAQAKAQLRSLEMIGGEGTTPDFIFADLHRKGNPNRFAAMMQSLGRIDRVADLRVLGSWNDIPSA